MAREARAWDVRGREHELDLHVHLVVGVERGKLDESGDLAAAGLQRAEFFE